MRLPSIDDLGDIAGKRVLVRVDFNVPLAERNGKFVVTDDFRIRSALPLFRDLQARGAEVSACTHLGRPLGEPVAKYSVEPVREHLDTLIDDVHLLENLRFSPGEEGNDRSFGIELTDSYDCYVNEAFGVSHRAHASIMVPPTLIPSAAGPNLAHEVETLTGLLMNPRRPFVAIVGGAKVADKLGITKVLVEKADAVIVGGGMAFTFWRALGRTIGDSLVDDSRIDEVAELLASGRVHIPDDVWALPTGSPFGSGGSEKPTHYTGNIPDGFIALDIGPDTSRRFAEIVSSAGTVLWNGPMGVFEDPRLAAGTRAVADALAGSDAISVVGGGDSAAAVEQFGVASQMSFISTGGGASLELLEFGDLPGLRALRGE
ncbi:MAG: phosphoglycerate kinase [Actinobacteria bacterium]|uniref:phosphoglycerate kinase n=1 Tax=freshwater metagenome TaxID=449393 RepID=A0A6J6X4X3_9ZZZZ|nr:phosphoglycerate kinase [Actinomycetota bacterium]